jgi:hypothetical protein
MLMMPDVMLAVSRPHLSQIPWHCLSVLLVVLVVVLLLAVVLLESQGWGAAHQSVYRPSHSHVRVLPMRLHYRILVPSVMCHAAGHAMRIVVALLAVQHRRNQLQPCHARAVEAGLQF